MNQNERVAQAFFQVVNCAMLRKILLGSHGGFCWMVGGILAGKGGKEMREIFLRLPFHRDLQIGKMRFGEFLGSNGVRNGRLFVDRSFLLVEG